MSNECECDACGERKVRQIIREEVEGALARRDERRKADAQASSEAALKRFNESMAVYSTLTNKELAKEG